MRVTRNVNKAKRVPVRGRGEPAHRVAGDPSLNTREKQLARVLEMAWTSMDPKITDDLFKAPNGSAGLQVALHLEQFRELFEDILAAQIAESGKRVYNEIYELVTRPFRKAEGDPPPLPKVARGHYAFNVASPAATKYAKTEAAAMINDLTQSQIAATRALVLQGFTDGRTVRQTSRALVAVLEEGGGIQTMGAMFAGPTRGLTKRGATAVYNRGASLAAKGMSQAQIEKQLDTYGGRLRKARAKAIARTETMRASNQGRLEGMRQAQLNGLLTAQARKQWQTSRNDVCPICVGLAGVTAEIEASFPGGVGSAPPAHTNCRCSIRLLPDPETYGTPTQGVGQIIDPKFPKNIGANFDAKFPAVQQPTPAKPPKVVPEPKPSTVEAVTVRPEYAEKMLREAEEAGLFEPLGTPSLKNLKPKVEARSVLGDKIREIARTRTMEKRSAMLTKLRALDDELEALTDKVAALPLGNAAEKVDINTRIRAVLRESDGVKDGEFTLYRETVLEILSDFREMGPADPLRRNALGVSSGSSSVAVDSLDEAARFFPRDWIDSSVASRKKVEASHSTDRAFYSSERLILTTSPGDSVGQVSVYARTTTHELTHRMEQVVDQGRLMAEEWAHKAIRTTAPDGTPDPIKKLSDLTGLAYGPKEVTREDEFWSPYVGKIYGNDRGKNASEVLSMGIESLFHDRMGIMDPASEAFTLGVLATAGRPFGWVL
jgi:hypothetical protein